MLKFLAKWLPEQWYRPTLSIWLVPLFPLMWFFQWVSGVRSFLYRSGFFNQVRLPVPVVVVGNVTVGGSGKTPVVISLVEQLKARGWKPAIISRGYGRQSTEAQIVNSDNLPEQVGDEPMLLWQRTGVPVCVAQDRSAAGRLILSRFPNCNVIVSDDGLQHYRLYRDLEIVVFGERGVGNGRCLPVGPLREKISRLKSVQAVIVHGLEGEALGGLQSAPAFQNRSFFLGEMPYIPRFGLSLAPTDFYRLDQPVVRCSAPDLIGRSLVAIAGIGYPERFFQTLRGLGLVFDSVAFPDHHVFEKKDLSFPAGTVLLMTEKDAVKCRPLIQSEAWVLPVDATLWSLAGRLSLLDLVVEKLNGCSSAGYSGVSRL